MHIQLTGNKQDILATFRHLVKKGQFSDTNHNPAYTGKRWDDLDLVDRNQTAAFKQCHPYVGHVVVSGKIGLNGKIGGAGTYGD